MSTATDERIDLDLIEWTEKDEDEVCWSMNCQSKAEWVAVLSCGHAPPYCSTCKLFVDLVSQRNKLTCSAYKTRTHVIRWEKK